MYGGHAGAGPTAIVGVFKLLKPSNLKFLQIWFDTDEEPRIHCPSTSCSSIVVGQHIAYPPQELSIV